MHSTEVPFNDRALTVLCKLVNSFVLYHLSAVMRGVMRKEGWVGDVGLRWVVTLITLIVN